MTFQYIINHLDKPHKWFTVLTGPHAELSTKQDLERKGVIAYVPLTSVRRRWAGRIKEIHTPAVTRCVFVYATDEEIRRVQERYAVLPPRTAAALYQNQ